MDRPWCLSLADACADLVGLPQHENAIILSFPVFSQVTKNHGNSPELYFQACCNFTDDEEQMEETEVLGARVTTGRSHRNNREY